MKNVVYVNTVDTRQKLWQSIQDAANEICTTSGVFKHVQDSFWHRADTCVHAHCRHFEHLLKNMQQVNPPWVKYFTSERCWMEHYTLELLSSVTFYRKTSGPIFIGPFWLILMSWSSPIIYDTQFKNTLYMVSGEWHLKLHFTWDDLMTSAMHWVNKDGKA
jgi:hypothetical protein